MGDNWTQAEAIALCREIEQISPRYGCHVALTGGTLYKDGPRKDADIMLYRIRQWEAINTGALFQALYDDLGITKSGEFGWVWKALYCGKNIDFFFPEFEGAEYNGLQDLRPTPTPDTYAGVGRE